MKSFLPFYAVIALLGLLISALLYMKLGYVAAYTDFTAATCFFVFSSPFIFWFSIRGVKMNSNYAFMNYFYLGFALKFFLAIAFVIAYLAYTGHKGMMFGMSFAGNYIVYSALETIFTVRESNKITAASKK